jgi:hypothetical protein
MMWIGHDTFTCVFPQRQSQMLEKEHTAAVKSQQCYGSTITYPEALDPKLATFNESNEDEIQCDAGDPAPTPTQATEINVTTILVVTVVLLENAHRHLPCTLFAVVIARRFLYRSRSFRKAFPKLPLACKLIPLLHHVGDWRSPHLPLKDFQVTLLLTQLQIDRLFLYLWTLCLLLTLNFGYQQAVELRVMSEPPGL